MSNPVVVTSSRRRLPFPLLFVLAATLLATTTLIFRGAHAFPPQSTRVAKPSAFLPSSASHGCAAAAAARLPRGFQSLSASAATSPSTQDSAAGPEMKLCKNCKQYFNPAENTDRSCRYHTKAFTGDTKRKGDWSANADRFENERQWWCCGETDVNAPGCKYDRHRSYDDE